MEEAKKRNAVKMSVMQHKFQIWECHCFNLKLNRLLCCPCFSSSIVDSCCSWCLGVDLFLFQPLESAVDASWTVNTNC
ncbi:hypothetical protein Sjap_016384 [Stephania japonica]|uniref:Uncharacterized protein n=1 Tax=Stephania japonica TaxID=461633 RepID=A0AAP0IMX5_9MAGN